MKTPVGSPRMTFLPEVLREHRLLRTSLWSHISGSRLAVILTTPLIYSLLIPFVLLDLSVTLYQAVCFPVYGVPRVRRSDYLIFDRGRLAYLNAIEKVGCVYCSYANGLLAYIAEIAARTEQRFCPIRHASPLKTEHSRYPRFVPFGDARGYRARSGAIAHEWADIIAHSPSPPLTQAHDARYRAAR